MRQQRYSCFGGEPITYFRNLSTAGFVATAISFGPARMGFGLFVPEFKSAFSMSASVVGVVSSLGFIGFFIGLLLAEFLLNRLGPKVPVLSGLFVGMVGMGIVALAPNLPVLTLGVFSAASSAGFAWTPFNDAVHRKIGEMDRPAALSAISTGTSLGITTAGMVAIGMVVSGLSWRLCWAFFAFVSGGALVANWAGLRNVGKAAGNISAKAWRDLFCVEAIPLFVIAFVYGMTSAIFISFAADQMRYSGGFEGVPIAIIPALVFICLGLFGLAGLFTGRVKESIGLPWLLRLLMLAGASSIILVAIFPGNWGGLIGSAGLQGIHIMMTSAVLALWSDRLFPSLPSLSFTAALLASAAGNVFGPAVAGVMSDAFGGQAMFVGTAVLPTLTAIVLRERHVREQSLSKPPKAV